VSETVHHPAEPSVLALHLHLPPPHPSSSCTLCVYPAPVILFILPLPFGPISSSTASIFGWVCNLPGYVLMFPSRGSHGYPLLGSLQFVDSRSILTDIIDTTAAKPSCLFSSAFYYPLRSVSETVYDPAEPSVLALHLHLPPPHPSSSCTLCIYPAPVILFILPLPFGPISSSTASFFGWVCNLPGYVLMFPSRGSHGYLLFGRLQVVGSISTLTDIIDTTAAKPCCLFASAFYYHLRSDLVVNCLNLRMGMQLARLRAYVSLARVSWVFVVW
jgi:hypothetical protein